MADVQLVYLFNPGYLPDVVVIQAVPGVYCEAQFVRQLAGFVDLLELLLARLICPGVGIGAGMYLNGVGPDFLGLLPGPSPGL